MIGIIRWVLHWWSSAAAAPVMERYIGTIQSPGNAGTISAYSRTGTALSPGRAGTIRTADDIEDI